MKLLLVFSLKMALNKKNVKNKRELKPKFK